MRNMIDQLMQFNFTESEAKVYIALLQNAQSTGYEAAKSSGVSRSKVYETLDSLHRKGVIIVSMGQKTKLYSAVPVNELTNILERKIKQNLVNLSKLGNEFDSKLDTSAIWEINDLEATMQRAIEMIRGAQEELMIQIWAPELSKEIEDELLLAEAKGIRFLCILYDSKQKYQTKLGKVYRHGFEHDKIAERSSRWMTIVKDKESMLHLSVDGVHVSQAFFTRNRTMTFFAEEYVMHDAYCLRLIDHLRQTVKETFGEDMEHLRDIFALPLNISEETK